MIAYLQLRLADWRRERRIARLLAAMVRNAGKGPTPYQRALWSAMRDEIMARSPQQIARMERRQGVSHA